MSKLSVLIRRFRRTSLIEGIVEYLETVDIPKSAKKAVAMAAVKALHEQTGGKWDAEIEAAVSGGIEWTLDEVREWARRNDPTPDDDPNKPKGEAP